VRLARIHGVPAWVLTPGAHGAVVRDGDSLAAFCLLRETALGFIIDELWPEKTRRGLQALHMLSDWIEQTVARIARERSTRLDLGGIVRLDNKSHALALQRRDYEVVAEVYKKSFFPDRMFA
jgi:hypothetical protein